MLTREKIPLLIHDTCEQCQQLLPISQCWLYGSYARGGYDEESDIDIMMTTEADESTVRANRRALSVISSRLSLKYDITVSITIRTTEEFEKRDGCVPYYRNILREGQAYAI